MTPRVEAGDLWALGDHRLFCGDSASADDVAALMDGQTRPRLLIADPPYGMAYTGLDGPKLPGLRRRTVTPIKGDDKPFDPMPAVALSGCREVFLWGGDWFYDKLPAGGSWIVWDKRASAAADAIPGAPFEVCWSKKRHARKFVRVPWGGWYCKEPGDTERWHPAQKPVKVLAFVLGICAGDVYDPFLGSGTTLIAAERLGRRCFGMELSPDYCSIIISRWEKETGRTARRLSAALSLKAA